MTFLGTYLPYPFPLLRFTSLPIFPLPPSIPGGSPLLLHTPKEERKHVILCLLGLVYFTLHNSLQFYPSSCKQRDLTLLYSWIKLYRVCIPILSLSSRVLMGTWLTEYIGCWNGVEMDAITSYRPSQYDHFLLNNPWSIPLPLLLAGINRTMSAFIQNVNIFCNGCYFSNAFIMFLILLCVAFISFIIHGTYYILYSIRILSLVIIFWSVYSQLSQKDGTVQKFRCFEASLSLKMWCCYSKHPHMREGVSMGI